MKKIISYIFIVFILVFAPNVAYSQFLKSTTTKKFISSLERFHKRLTAASGHANLLVTTPSTANLVKFPHFSLGGQVGATFDMKTFGKLLSDAEGSLAAVSPDNLFDNIPGVGLGTAATLRFGGGGIPFDIGFHAMYIPIPINTGLAFSRLTVGGDFRYALLEDKDKKPGISIGFKYAYTLSKLEWFWDHMSFQSMLKNSPITISLQDSKMELNFSDHVIGIPLQVSKLLASFFEPYVGLEPFIVIGNLSFASKIQPKVKHNGKTYDMQKFVRRFGKIASGIFDEKGLNYNSNVVNGGIRLYGGFALKLWLFYFDTQVSYEPINHEFGLGTGFRFQY